MMTHLDREICKSPTCDKELWHPPTYPTMIRHKPGYCLDCGAFYAESEYQFLRQLMPVNEQLIENVYSFLKVHIHEALDTK